MISASGPSKQKPAFLKGMLWFLFSGTAMASAFILPVHTFAVTMGVHMKLSSFFFRAYFFILFFCGLFHSVYRTKTILFDLGITKGQRFIGRILTIIFSAAIFVSAYLFFLQE